MHQHVKRTRQDDGTPTGDYSLAQAPRGGRRIEHEALQLPIPCLLPDWWDNVAHVSCPCDQQCPESEFEPLSNAEPVAQVTIEVLDAMRGKRHRVELPASLASASHSFLSHLKREVSRVTGDADCPRLMFGGKELRDPRDAKDCAALAVELMSRRSAAPPLVVAYRRL